MNPKKLYDLWTETVGGGKQGHPHWDNLDDKDKFQFDRLHKRLCAEYFPPVMTLGEVPPPGDPTGGPPTS